MLNKQLAHRLYKQQVNAFSQRLLTYQIVIQIVTQML